MRSARMPLKKSWKLLLVRNAGTVLGGRDSNWMSSSSERNTASPATVGPPFQSPPATKLDEVPTTLADHDGPGVSLPTALLLLLSPVVSSTAMDLDEEGIVWWGRNRSILVLTSTTSSYRGP